MGSHDTSTARLLAAAGLVPLAVCPIACGRGESVNLPSAGSGGPLPQSPLVHLDAELAHARVQSAPAPAREPRTWRFDEEHPEWHSISPGVALERRKDALRMSFAPVADRTEPGPPSGGIAVELEGGELHDWTGLLVRARTHDRMAGITAVHNVAEPDALPGPFFFFGDGTPVFSDGSEQTYHLPFRPREPSESLRSVGLVAASLGRAHLDVLSLTLVPRGADFSDAHGTRTVTRASVTRTTLYAHAPASLAWDVRVPAGGRLDVGLACLPHEAIAYRATVRTGAGEARVVLDRKVGDAGAWEQVSVDLSPWSGAEVELTLSAASQEAGAVALWGAPIVSGRTDSPERARGARPARASRPDVVFYVIDGGGADLMSVYGYNRRTTPFLERLAEQGVVFERAFSNSTWTQSSTASFMTGLQHSVLGGLRRGMHSTPVPLAAVTMAEHMRRGGYLTASFTSNPNAGRVIGLERGLDLMRDVDSEHHSTSSAELHENYFRFREDYPAGPCWVHFQTTDVHEPNEPVPPFAGLFVSRDERENLHGWDERLFTEAGELFGTTSISRFYDLALERTGIDRQRYFNTRRGLYDETMAHQDRELARFVERLKARGEWENTLLVIAADHGHPAGTFARFGRGLFDPQPEGWQGALFDAYATRVPLVFVWPARIAGGRRFEQPVSMIDVLPTILELCGLPAPEVVQGRSLAPLLLQGRATPHEVVLDEFRVDEATGEMIGNIEIVDGRWGASLEIGPGPAGADPARGRHAVPAGGRWGAVHPFFPETPRLLLYDLWRDPFALRAVNDEQPELVERYEKLLRERWAAHRALAQRFGEAADTPLDPAQLEQLQALGYIR
jgi:arylsulfatase A-like enzyme